MSNYDEEGNQLLVTLYLKIFDYHNLRNGQNLEVYVMVGDIMKAHDCRGP